MLNNISWIVYTGVKEKAGKKILSFITDVYAEVSPHAYQTVV